MNYDKNQFRDFFNQMALELQGRHGEPALHELRQRHGCAMLEPTNDPAKLQGRKELLDHLKSLSPLLKFILARMQ